MEYRKFDNTWFVRIDRGEEILASLAEVCRREGITLGTITGIGAVGEVTLGVFDRGQFAYQSETYTGDFEIASCSGTVTTMEGEPYFHLHMAAANPVNSGVSCGYNTGLPVGIKEPRHTDFYFILRPFFLIGMVKIRPARMKMQVYKRRYPAHFWIILFINILCRHISLHFLSFQS